MIKDINNQDIDIKIIKNKKILIITKEQFKPVLKEVNALLTNNKTDIKNIFIIIVNIIEIIDKLQLKGLDKFHLTCEILYLILEEKQSDLYKLVDLSPQNREFLVLVSGNFIECIIKISKGKLIKNNKDTIKLNVDEVVDKVYNQVKIIINKEDSKLKDKIAGYLGLVMGIMGLLETESHVAGKDKKKIALRVINKLVDDQTIIADPDNKNLIKNIVNITPDFIDIIKDVSNGKFNINEVLDDIDVNEVGACLCNFYKVCSKTFHTNKNLKNKK